MWDQTYPIFATSRSRRTANVSSLACIAATRRDRPSWRAARRFTASHWPLPRGVSFSRDGRLAASGTWRGFVYLWTMPGLFDDERDWSRGDGFGPIGEGRNSLS